MHALLRLVVSHDSSAWLLVCSAGRRVPGVQVQ